MVTSDFDLNFTPQASEIGKFITLTNEITASARDTKTEASLSHTRDALTTELLTDETGAGRGAVME